MNVYKEITLLLVEDNESMWDATRELPALEGYK